MKRRKRGSLLVLIACILAACLMFVMIPCFNFSKLALARQSQHSGIEAAALAAARDLSRIVIEDPHFGFISLSDHPPIGRATCAPDGEPLPVTGINTIIGTCRLEMLIACELDNEEMKQLASRDSIAARQASQRLSMALTRVLAPERGFTAKDVNGEAVRPYQSAERVLGAGKSRATMLGVARLKSLKLSLGWLKEGGSTQTQLPQPFSLARLPVSHQSRQTYMAFVDLPVENESYFFAGLSQQPSLVDVMQFRNADRMRISSVVKAEADLEFSGMEPVHIAACAQPGALTESNPPGILVVSFPNGLIPELRCLRDLVGNRQLASKSVQLFRAENGDFPDDPQARLCPASVSESAVKVSSVLNRGVYDWIRTAHSRVRIDSLLEVFERPFKDSEILKSGSSQQPYLVYEFDRQGRVVTSNLRATPFMRQTVHENQIYALGLNAITFGDYSWTLSFRDQVNELGLLYGGRHGGQPLAGEPVNWCELKEFNSSREQALERGKGGKWLGLNVLGQTTDLGAESVALSSALFVRPDGACIPQARKSYYSGGLAVEIVLSSPTLAKL